MPDVNTLTPEQVLTERNRPEVKLVDVRTDDEWLYSHIPGALHIPLHELAERYPAQLAVDDEIIIYCQHGIRSRNAALLLMAGGFTNISHMAGGLAMWSGPVEEE